MAGDELRGQEGRAVNLEFHGSGRKLVLADRVARAINQASAARLPGVLATGRELGRPAQMPDGSVGFVFQDGRSLITTMSKTGWGTRHGCGIVRAACSQRGGPLPHKII